MAKYEEQDYSLVIEPTSQPGALGFKMVFRSTDATLTFWVFKWPRYQNGKIFCTDLVQHTPVEPGDYTAQCEYSPTGHCSPYSVIRSTGAGWEYLMEPYDLACTVIETLVRGHVAITPQEDEQILHACERFWEIEPLPNE